ncbi:MAG: hypothetical protein AAF611_17355 [Bacteroidota bacterium]
MIKTTLSTTLILLVLFTGLCSFTCQNDTIQVDPEDMTTLDMIDDNHAIPFYMNMPINISNLPAENMMYWWLFRKN